MCRNVETSVGRIVKVAERRHIPEGTGIAVTIGALSIAVFNVGGQFYATSDVCPHAGGPLSEGWIEDKQVTCPWHGWTFDLDPGEESPHDGLHRYPVIVNGEDIKIELPD